VLSKAAAAAAPFQGPEQAAAPPIVSRYDTRKKQHQYIRAVVTDQDGHHAWVQAVFLDDTPYRDRRKIDRSSRRGFVVAGEARNRSCIGIPQGFATKPAAMKTGVTICSFCDGP